MSKTRVSAVKAFVLAGGNLFQQPALAEGTEEALAKRLSNPIAVLISVPFQFNYNQGLGPDDDGEQWQLNVQPVIPFSLTPDWNLISRTIVPLIHQSDIFPGAGSQPGLGDVLQSLFFSPAAPTAGGWIWGVGPALLLPTGSDDLLTADKWAAGPTAVALRQNGPWTVGALASHLCPLRATATAAMSTRRSCSHSCPTRPRRPGPTRSRARVSATGIKSNGSSRSARRRRRSLGSVASW